MKFAVVIFPGSNCDRDCVYALKDILGQKVITVWHKETILPKVDALILPGGFSYGDYLRCGAIARFSPIMKEVSLFAHRGGPVLGICNGFQILLEAGLLPGAMLRNRGLQFICDTVWIRPDSLDTRFTRKIPQGKVLKIPIAHGEGNYFIDATGLKRLEGEGQVAFRYTDENGAVTDAANPNGSLHNIAGILNGRKNVLGMMPHPERVSDPILGSTDGRFILESLLS